MSGQPERSGEAGRTEPPLLDESGVAPLSGGSGRPLAACGQRVGGDALQYGKGFLLSQHLCEPKEATGQHERVDMRTTHRSGPALTPKTESEGVKSKCPTALSFPEGARGSLCRRFEFSRSKGEQCGKLYCKFYGTVERVRTQLLSWAGDGYSKTVSSPPAPGLASSTFTTNRGDTVQLRHDCLTAPEFCCSDEYNKR